MQYIQSLLLYINTLTVKCNHLYFALKLRICYINEIKYTENRWSFVVLSIVDHRKLLICELTGFCTMCQLENIVSTLLK